MNSRPHRHAFTGEQLASRAALVPVVTYPDDLPVSARRDDIAEAIRHHQVVIVCGETGSGKTTQLPKICLQLGRGVAGMIGHTQPRRIAARAVADRIASELGSRVGRGERDIVGYQVRFTDEVGPNTLVKLMTDGILLTEIQHDPDLTRYDTIIIDEAHERSLNIDFLIGYLARLRTRRPDLSIIITSATIDAERFAAHFSDANGTPAPVVEVSGRTYPVEIRYRPLSPDQAVTTDDAASAGSTGEDRTSSAGLVLESPDDPLALDGYGTGEDIDYLTGICHAVDELCEEGEGDILVFLPGERDIRDTDAALRDHLGSRHIAAGEASATSPLDGIEVVPLYSRLSAPEQQRIFQPHPRRRVVLATNVAETSLTVPGIRYVIDPGLARISRYSNRTKVQRLPIEAVSQASANQRSGRCGRVADGVAIRLYSQRDFLTRPRFTEPEIQRTSLASVILQMANLRLGSVEQFPFLDAPSPKSVRDGVALLEEIGALRHAHRDGEKLRLTALGRDLARLPIDPRLGRMLVEADRLGCASEVAIIVAALSMQDVRERPEAMKGDADTAHARFLDPTSDFITYLTLWRYLRCQARDLSSSAFRRLCRREFLHYLRWREWQDVVAQLTQLARAARIRIEPIEIPSSRDIRTQERTGGVAGAHARAALATTNRTSRANSDRIHQAILVGLLSNIGTWDSQRSDYEGARNARFVIWPGSGLANSHYDWVMAAELVETSRLFARTVAKIDPAWVERAGRHLVKRSYSEPYWSTRNTAAMVRERVTLYGVTIVANRPMLLANVPDTVALDSAALSTNALGSTTLGSTVLGGAAMTALADVARNGGMTAGATPREIARDMFIRHALVDGDWDARHRFLLDNRQLIEAIREDEKRLREGSLIDEDAIVAFYDERIPDDVVSAGHFNRWWRRQRNSTLLTMKRHHIVRSGVEVDLSDHPTHWEQDGMRFPLSYDFTPGSTRDGVSVHIPLTQLGRVRDVGFDWLVPGMLTDLVVATIRALPKAIRTRFVPAPQAGDDIAAWIRTEILSDNSGVENTNSADASGRTDRTPTGEATQPAENEASVDPTSLEASLGRLAAWAKRSGTASDKTIRQLEQMRDDTRATATHHTAAHAAAPRDDTPQASPDSSTPLSPPSFTEAFIRAARAVRGVDLDPAIFDDVELPPHARMHFVAVDERGREVRAGDDLTALQRQLAATTDNAVRSTMREALARASRDVGARQSARRPKRTSKRQGDNPQHSKQQHNKRQHDRRQVDNHTHHQPRHLDNWPRIDGDNDVIPREIDTTTPEGTVVRAYLGLSPDWDDTTLHPAHEDAHRSPLAHEANALASLLATQEPRARIAITSDAGRCARLHADGVALLLDARLSLSTTRVSTRWTGREALTLAAGPYRSTDTLIAHAQYAAARHLVTQSPTAADEIRSRETFDALVAWARPRFEDAVYQVMRQVVEVFTEFGQLNAALRHVSSPALIGVLHDVSAHAASLVNDTMVVRIPPARLSHVARYIRADRLRVEKAARSGAALARDEANARSLATLLARLDAVAHADAVAGDEVRWMVEELRVSLFAQELGTAQKVSLKRLYQVIDDLETRR